MNTFSCCLVWFLLGFLLGWILNWLLRKCFCGSCKVECKSNDENNQVKNEVTPSSVNTLVSERSEVVEPVAVVVPPQVKVVAFDKAAAKAAGFSVKNVNDLTVVEGIGPKINELLQADGIKTFAELAAADVASIQAILDKAGSRYRLAKPSTWPQQAALAAENRWGELKTLQDGLKGGV